MRLVSKVVLVLMAVIALSVTLNHFILQSTVSPAFARLEQESAERNAERVLDAIASESRHLGFSAQDWANWDDTHEFVSRDPPEWHAEYIDSNLYIGTLTGMNLNLMYFVDLSGEVVWSMIIDGDQEEISLAALPPDRIAADSPLLDHPTEQSIVTGIMPTEYAPMLVVSLPVLTSEATGPAAGTLIFGRFLDESLVESLRDQTHVDFHLFTADDIAVDDSHREIIATLATEVGGIVAREDGNVLATYGLLRDIQGLPILLLHAETPRDISAVGEATTRFASLLLVAAGLAVMLVTGLLLQQVVLGPILKLTRHTLAIKQTGDLTRRLAISRKDEIGVLSTEFDGMMGQLAEARHDLLEQSYQAGLAEMASGILHNIRNQINPLIVGLGRLRNMLAAPSKAKIEQAFAELSNDDASPERRAKMIKFLRLTFDRSFADHRKVSDELNTMARQVARVEEVLAEQDRFSHANRVIEATDLSDVLSRAITLLPEIVGQSVAIEVDRSVETAIPVLAERFVLTQLLMNAAEAISAGETEQGRIDISASVQTLPDGGSTVDLAVRDNGRGIEDGTLQTIFERGFTTKADRKGGLGLHWCANSIAGLSGRIFAESGGLQQGAVLHLVLPVAEKSVETAA